MVSKSWDALREELVRQDEQIAALDSLAEGLGEITFEISDEAWSNIERAARAATVNLTPAHCRGVRV